MKETSSKKRRKDLSTSENLQKIQLSNPLANDEYRMVVKYEEEEAALRDSEQDLILLCNICNVFRKIQADIVALHATKTPQSAAQIAAKRQHCSLVFVTLKRLNRLEKFRTEQDRERLQKARLQTDSCHLQLQNLLYEVIHLEKEISKCLQFKSKEDGMELVAVEEFYKHAPESISRPLVTKENAHQLKLARLEWEMKQRTELSLLCSEVKSEKEAVNASCKKIKTQLRNLRPMLCDILVVAVPVEELLDLNIGLPPAMEKAITLLPHPLYFLFLETSALREAGERCLTVKIQGDEEDAVRMRQTMQETVSFQDSDSDTQEDVVGKRHGHRKKSRVDKLEERKKQLLMAHPLTVVIDIKLTGTTGSISLEFTYFVKLHVVTVKATVKIPPEMNLSSTSPSSKLADNEHILVELFREDFGEGSPNPANIYQLNKVGITSFNTAQLGVAYMWAQQICGLRFASSKGAEEAAKNVSQVNLPQVIKTIKRRMLSRTSLCQQLQSLENKVIPNFPEVRKCFPQKLIVELTQWSSLSWPAYQALGFTQQVIDNGFVSERDMFYKGTLVRSNARLIMAVAISNFYPGQPPLFTLQAAYGNNTTQAANNDSIRDIEREVNVYHNEMLKKSSLQNILTAQILRLMTCFDILLEASTNQDFPRDKIFIQPNRGRNRAWPFKGIDRGDGVFHFTQR